MTPLQAYDAEVRFIVEWATYITDGIDTYKRNRSSTSEET